jgi:signal transduction histidine kinase
VATVVDAPDGHHDMVLIHDAALSDDRELLDGVTGIVVAERRHEWLVADLSQAMSDLAESRRRIAEAADQERGRIERDLHDGAQQRLISLRIRLGLAEDRLQTDPAAGIQELRELGFEVGHALDELRSLAHGVYPAVLADRGLSDALASLARQATLPVHVVTTGVTRHPIKIESAVYFSCSEALQNAVKHAAGASAVRIRLRQTAHLLHFEVHDDGAGFAPDEHDGHGLRNMHDRMNAVGGRLTIDSRPGHGTHVLGDVELS